ncbi:hypothetical protein [Prevotella melaninogenica]|uniref:hypothetical protein n=1 Tax=Prevotella melaninogenica TaxID=28132 RepID=UPI0028ECB58D|nr:hypothetical protein [Prevotella melaninogenica]
MQIEDRRRTFETPWEIPVQKRIGDYIIEYRKIIEFSQGSPLIGFLYINNEKIGKDELFGTPFLLKENYLYIPKYVRRYWKSGFILCKIDLRTGRMDNIGKIKPLIYLDSIDERKILYYTDYTKSKEETYYL